jgi:hypothetical protein
MHNHVATPTKQWVELIKDPAKFGRVIKEDNFPRVPGSLLRQQWVESGNGTTGSSPPEFPPTLFYGPTREPMVVTPEEGGLESMGGMIPDPSLTVDDVSHLVGPDKMVDVIGESDACCIRVVWLTHPRRCLADFLAVAFVPMGRVRQSAITFELQPWHGLVLVVFKSVQYYLP